MLPLITDLNNEGQFPLATFQLDIKALKIDVLFDTTQYITIYSLKSLLTLDPSQWTQVVAKNWLGVTAKSPNHVL